MKQVLILSDSHGLTGELVDIKNRHKDVDHFIHCGDSELSENAPFLSGYQTVSGNCDWNGNFPNELILELDGLTFYITHGHLFGVKGSLLNLQKRAQDAGADVACFGHSHVLYAEKMDKCLFINPGSIRLPKKIREASYIIMSWDHPNDIRMQYYNVNGNRLKGLPSDENFSFL